MVNQLTQTSKDLEHQKGMNEQTNIVLDDLKKQTETKEKELKSLQSDLHQSKFEVHKKQGTVDSLRKKLEQLTPKSGVSVVHINCCICGVPEDENLFFGDHMCLFLNSKWDISIMDLKKMAFIKPGTNLLPLDLCNL